MKIITAGMYRSGTTYQFNAIRVIMEMAHGKENVYSCFIDEYKPNSKEVQIIKTHKILKRTANIVNHSDYILSTHRSKEGILGSMKRRAEYLEKNPDNRFSKEADHKNFEKYYMNSMYFYNRADYIQEFDSIGTKELIQDYLNLFNLDLDADLILKELDNIKPPKKGYDPVSLLHSGHITSK
jgi:hypothetical protein